MVKRKKSSQRIKTVSKTDSFHNHLRKASEIIKEWPQWKKDVLGIEDYKNGVLRLHEKVSERK